MTGLYFFDEQAAHFTRGIKPSNRGELEITSLINEYLKRKQLSFTKLSRGTAWLDTGTFDSLMQASQFIQVIEQTQGIKVACIEEIAWRKGFISKDELVQLAKPLLKSGYGNYIMGLIDSAS